MTRGDTRPDPVTPPEPEPTPDPVNLTDPIKEADPEEVTLSEEESEEREVERLRKENDRLATEVHGLRSLVESIGNPGETQVSPDDDDYDPREGVPAIFRGATGHNADEPDGDA